MRDHDIRDTKEEPKRVTATYPSPAQAQRAVDELLDAGVDRGRISLAMNEEVREEYFPEKRRKSPEGGKIGLAAGGAIGAITGAAIGIATFPIGGGLLFAAGPVFATMAGAAGGAAGGGVLGALIGAGFTETEARTYERRLQEGEVLVSVKPESIGEAEKAEAVLNEIKAFATARGATRHPEVR